MTDKKDDQVSEYVEGVYTTSTDDSSIQIAENVFISIIKNYTLEIPEVVRFAPSGFVGSLAEMIGKKSSSKPILVDFDEADQVTIAVSVVLKFGCHVPTVAEKIQTSLSEKVEQITGKDVVKVNVSIIDLVQDTEVEEEEKQEEES